MRPLSIRPHDLRGALEPDGWLGHRTEARFAAFAARPPALPPGDAERYFAARGLRIPAGESDDRALAHELVALDLRAIAHALSLLHSEQTEPAALELLPAAARAVLADDPPSLDHVGLEVFGRLEWYLLALAAWARSGGIQLTLGPVFPSVQVRKALAYDPDLAAVRIARVWLRNAGRSLNLELFEAAQDWRYTTARQLSRLCELGRSQAAALFEALGQSLRLPLEPVEHLALRVERWQTVEAVHRSLAHPAERAASQRLYDEELSYNASDASLNSKIVTSSVTHAGVPLFGPIVELISYGVHHDPRRSGLPRPNESDAGDPRVPQRHA